MIWLHCSNCTFCGYKYISSLRMQRNSIRDINDVSNVVALCTKRWLECLRFDILGSCSIIPQTRSRFLCKRTVVSFPNSWQITYWVILPKTSTDEWWNAMVFISSIEVSTVSSLRANDEMVKSKIKFHDLLLSSIVHFSKGYFAMLI